MTPTIKVTQFDPLQLELPAEPGPYTGEVKIELPPIHVKVRELFGPSWGAIAEGMPFVGGEMPGGVYTITIADGASMTVGELVEFVTNRQDLFKQVNDLYQKHFDDAGALLEPVMG